MEGKVHSDLLWRRSVFVVIVMALLIRGDFERWIVQFGNMIIGNTESESVGTVAGTQRIR